MDIGTWGENLGANCDAFAKPQTKKRGDTRREDLKEEEINWRTE